MVHSPGLTDSFIKPVQKQLGLEPDGDDGLMTWRAIYKAIFGVDAEQASPASTAPGAPSGTAVGFPQAAIDLILDAEGIDQPGAWPEGESGITLGFGCDIGADPDSLAFWVGVLHGDEVERLKAARGITGEAAHAIAHHFSDIRITREQALQVFREHTLPTEIAKTRATFKGIDAFPAALLGALTSLVFNRGTSLAGSRRTEMASIAAVITDQAAKPPAERELHGALRMIAGEFRAMKRLWGSDQGGLLKRRDAEAALVLSAIA